MTEPKVTPDSSTRLRAKTLGGPLLPSHRAVNVQDLHGLLIAGTMSRSTMGDQIDQLRRANLSDEAKRALRDIEGRFGRLHKGHTVPIEWVSPQWWHLPKQSEGGADPEAEQGAVEFDLLRKALTLRCADALIATADLGMPDCPDVMRFAMNAHPKLGEGEVVWRVLWEFHHWGTGQDLAAVEKARGEDYTLHNSPIRGYAAVYTWMRGVDRRTAFQINPDITGSRLAEAFRSAKNKQSMLVAQRLVLDCERALTLWVERWRARR